jgi:dTDP-4-dehydrorhamnose reductase
VQETIKNNKVGLQTTDRDFTAREFHREISLFFLSLRQYSKKFLKKSQKSKPLEITNDQVFRKEWMEDIVRAKIS